MAPILHGFNDLGTSVSFGTASAKKSHARGVEMVRTVLMLIPVGTAVLAATLAAAPSENSASSSEPQTSHTVQSKEKAHRAARMTSLSGCIDEQNGQYVLVEDRTLQALTALRAQSFPQEGFATFGSQGHGSGHYGAVRRPTGDGCTQRAGYFRRMRTYTTGEISSNMIKSLSWRS
jgi:hypothetical protein